MFTFSGGYEVFSVLSQESLTEMSYTFEEVVPLTSAEDWVIGCFNNVKCDIGCPENTLFHCRAKHIWVPIPFGVLNKTANFQNAALMPSSLEFYLKI